ncbi:DUF1214 domain-containing protein [Desulfobacula sp.]|uniref:DUF1214 domain-containing protein n=1 Tax=Desulfobacula sp. TaxID=2593537 RepID=UPI002611C366|nr:DUF1214 domain-containing protein [Desulfobacula sp.]
MKLQKLLIILFTGLFISGIAIPMQAQEQVNTRIGDLEFTHSFENGYPTDRTIAKLFNEMDFQRACQAYIWSIPLMSFAQWQYAYKKKNWIPTEPGRAFFAMLRLYSPKKAFMDRSWVIPDVEKAK